MHSFIYVSFEKSFISCTVNVIDFLSSRMMLKSQKRCRCM